MLTAPRAPPSKRSKIAAVSSVAIPLAGDVGHEIHPVGPDVGDGPQRPASIWLESPVPVTLQKKPVLEVAPSHKSHFAELAGGDSLARVLVERVVADVEVGRVDEAARRSQV